MKAIICPQCGSNGLEVNEDQLSVIGDSVIYIGNSDGIYKCSHCGTKSVLEPNAKYPMGGGQTIVATGRSVVVGGSNSGIIITGKK